MLMVNRIGVSVLSENLKMNKMLKTLSFLLIKE